jgi:hypothetical protein
MATPPRGKGLGSRLVLLALGVQEADELRGRGGEQREELGADTVEGRQLRQVFHFGLGEELGVKDAALHFELGEVLEEGDQDFGDAGRIVAAGDEGRVAAQVTRDVGEIRLLRGDVKDAVLNDVVLGTVGTELITDGSSILDGDAGAVLGAGLGGRDGEGRDGEGRAAQALEDEETDARGLFAERRGLF